MPTKSENEPVNTNTKSENEPVNTNIGFTKDGFTRAELLAAFELVENKSDWKAPIESYCTSDELKVVAAAIEFFTATRPKFDYIRQIAGPSMTNSRFTIGDHVMKVRADGYRMGPAGDH